MGTDAYAWNGARRTGDMSSLLGVGAVIRKALRKCHFRMLGVGVFFQHGALGRAQKRILADLISKFSDM